MLININFLPCISKKVKCKHRESITSCKFCWGNYFIVKDGFLKMGPMIPFAALILHYCSRCILTIEMILNLFGQSRCSKDHVILHICPIIWFDCVIPFSIGCRVIKLLKKKIFKSEHVNKLM